MEKSDLYCKFFYRKTDKFNKIDWEEFGIDDKTKIDLAEAYRKYLYEDGTDSFIITSEINKKNYKILFYHKIQILLENQKINGVDSLVESKPYKIREFRVHYLKGFYNTDHHIERSFKKTEFRDVIQKFIVKNIEGFDDFQPARFPNNPFFNRVYREMHIHIDDTSTFEKKKWLVNFLIERVPGISLDELNPNTENSEFLDQICQLIKRKTQEFVYLLNKFLDKYDDIPFLFFYFIFLTYENKLLDEKYKIKFDQDKTNFLKQVEKDEIEKKNRAIFWTVESFIKLDTESSSGHINEGLILMPSAIFKKENGNYVIIKETDFDKFEFFDRIILDLSSSFLFCEITVFKWQNNFEKFFKYADSQKLNKIKQLNLNNNYIHTEGFKIVFETVSRMESLEVLDLTFNLIDDLSFKEAIPKNSIKSLILSRNRITSQGMDDFIKFISEFEKLTLLDISSNKINTKKSLDDLIEALKKLPNFDTLDIRRNPYSNNIVLSPWIENKSNNHYEYQNHFITILKGNLDETNSIFDGHDSKNIKDPDFI